MLGEGDAMMGAADGDAATVDGTGLTDADGDGDAEGSGRGNRESSLAFVGKCNLDEMTCEAGRFNDSVRALDEETVRSKPPAAS